MESSVRLTKKHIAWSMASLFSCGVICGLAGWLIVPSWFAPNPHTPADLVGATEFSIDRIECDTEPRLAAFLKGAVEGCRNLGGVEAGAINPRFSGILVLQRTIDTNLFPTPDIIIYRVKNGKVVEGCGDRWSPHLDVCGQP